MDTEHTSLLACPFCNFKATLRERGDVFWVQCASFECRAEGSSKFSEAEAIAAWNTRATPEPVAPTPRGELGEPHKPFSETFLQRAGIDGDAAPGSPPMTLLSRIEALTGPDRDVDAELLKSFDDEHDTITRFFDSIKGWQEINGLGSKTYSHPAPLTSSVDAALAFAEKVLPGWFWRAGHVPAVHWEKGRGYDNWAHVSRTNASNCDREDEATGWADSVPLAIILAVLRAKEGT